jgi:hypothetical protein
VKELKRMGGLVGPGRLKLEGVDALVWPGGLELNCGASLHQVV